MRVVAPYLAAWPDVDLDLRSAFRFGGIAALLGHEIDLLITPDPLDLPGSTYTPVFDCELVLAVSGAHPIGEVAAPADLTGEVLITYPVVSARIRDGLPKSIHLGTRHCDGAIDYIAGFLELAKRSGFQPSPLE